MRRYWSAYFWLGLAVIFFAAGLVLVWVVNLDIPSFDTFGQRVVSQSTKIYDRTDKILLYDVHQNIKRRLVPTEAIAKDIKNATVAIEDSEFYEHRGVKPEAIIRAFLVNLGARSIKQGGSTITQQLIKNSLLTTERKLARKIKEVVLALKLEQVMSKEEILTLYLNETPYGGNLYGVEEATQTFFQKPASEVSLAEAAYLAAITKAPTFFSPYGNNRAALEERKNLVLDRMIELGFIGVEEAVAAKTAQVVFKPPTDQSIKAPHFVMWVINYLESKYGREALSTRGLKVTTTLNWDWQQKAEAVVTRLAKENLEKFNAHNAGLVALDPKTGQILTMVGSRDYYDTANDGNFNVTIAHRQPGSAFKPFVYATAFNRGYTPETVVFDLSTQFDTTCASAPNNCYQPINYDGRFRGPVTLREALAQSINIPAIKVLYLAGISKAIKLAQSMGIETLDNPNRYGLTLVLGGGEVTLLELTGGYGVLANDGIRNPTTAILKIEDAAGNVLETFQSQSRRVLPENTARLVSNILSDNEARTPAFGANSLLYIPTRPVAAKTGTTNDYKDAWIVGYTPNVVAGAWAGNNNNAPMEKRVAGFIVAPIWNAFMTEILPSLPVEQFAPPLPSNQLLKPVLRGFWRGGESYWVDKISQKLATDYTPPDLREERVLNSVHSILYWVNRDEPTGSPPSNPAADPQFKLWEGPVRQWAIQQGLIDETRASLPQEYDDIHKPEFAPAFQITSPNPNLTYSPQEKITVTAQASANRYPAAQIDVFFNDTYIGSAFRTPYQLSFIPGALDRLESTNQLRVVLYDTVRNKSEQTIQLRLGQN